MKLSALRPPESQNLIDTYFALGQVMAGSQVQEDTGFRYCTGLLEHPICNFAVELDLDLWSIHRLRELAKKHDVFHVYSLPGDDPRKTHYWLARSGFRESLKLIQLVSPGAAAEELDLEEAIGLDDRLRVGRFMSEQFFSDQSSAFQRVVTQATANSSLELHFLRENSGVVAAMMLCVSDHHVGVYNLCVHSSRRNRGLGSHLVRAALSRAAEMGKEVTLQCNEKLAGWYEQFGFAASGVVIVYSLPKR